MRTHALILRLIAPVFLAVSVLHLIMGPGADVLLGAGLAAETVRDPVLDSQNRFYGVSFALYGALLWLCASDPMRYRPVLVALWWVLLAAGGARGVAMAVSGVPSAPVLALLATELVLPPVMLLWLARVTARTPD